MIPILLALTFLSYESRSQDGDGHERAMHGGPRALHRRTVQAGSEPADSHTICKPELVVPQTIRTVKILKSHGPHRRGEILHTDHGHAQQLIAAGLAVRVGC